MGSPFLSFLSFFLRYEEYERLLTLIDWLFGRMDIGSCNNRFLVDDDDDDVVHRNACSSFLSSAFPLLCAFYFLFLPAVLRSYRNVLLQILFVVSLF